MCGKKISQCKSLLSVKDLVIPKALSSSYHLSVAQRQPMFLRCTSTNTDIEARVSGTFHKSPQTLYAPLGYQNIHLKKPSLRQSAHSDNKPMFHLFSNNLALAKSTSICYEQSRYRYIYVCCKRYVTCSKHLVKQVFYVTFDSFPTIFDFDLYSIFEIR